MKLMTEKDLLIKRAMITSFASTILLLLLPAIFWFKLREEVPLFYSLPWGESQVVGKGFLFVPAVMSLVFIGINLFLVRFLENDTFLKKILWAGGAIASVLALITLLRIILLFI